MKKQTVISLWVILASVWSQQAFGYGSCVASITPTSQSKDFINNGDGTVTNTKTKLMWKRCSEGQLGANCAKGKVKMFTWQGALKQAEIINKTGGFATFKDWRLPNISELKSIVEKQCMLPAINLTVFPATPLASKAQVYYWSASPYAANGKFAWFVDFDSGRSFASDKVKVKAQAQLQVQYYIRLVRGGQ